MSHELEDLELANFEKRLTDARFVYRRMKGRFPPDTWEAFHRARFQRFTYFRNSEDNTLGRQPGEVWSAFMAQDRPPIARGRGRFDDDWSQPMRGPDGNHA